MSEKKAFALKYPEGLDAPVIVAKGKGKLAEKIINEAQENKILIKEDTLLVDMLGLCDVGDYVPKETWEILAQIFAVILRQEKE